jgi:hypothetical protein
MADKNEDSEDRYDDLEQKENQDNNENQEQNADPKPQTTNPFEDLRKKAIEHGSGDFLQLQDGESVVVTVIVDLYNSDPTKRTPRFEKTNGYKNSTDEIVKLRIDCYIGSTKKKFYASPRQSRAILDILETGARKIRISRFGTGPDTRYTYTKAR